MQDPESSGIPARTALAFQGGIGVLGALLVWLAGIPVAWGPGSIHSALGYAVLGAVATYLALLTLSQLPGVLSRGLSDQMQALYRFATGFSWPVLVLLSLLAGVGEELLFRGAIQGWLTQHVGPWPAILAASVVFGLVHYLSLTYFLLATALGMVLGITYHVSDNLVLVMLWHAVYDVLALYCLLRFPGWFGVRP